MTLFSMRTVVLCHKWLRKQGKLDVQINVSWLKGKKNIIKIQELTLYQSPTCHRTNTEIPNKSPGTAGRVFMQSLLSIPSDCQNFKPLELSASSCLSNGPGARPVGRPALSKWASCSNTSSGRFTKVS